jgi:hypothetical protein
MGLHRGKFWLESISTQSFISTTEVKILIASNYPRGQLQCKDSQGQRRKRSIHPHWITHGVVLARTGNELDSD